MPVKRKYNIKGTNDFLVLALIFFFLCLWAIKDAWYPSEKVLKKHPREVVAAFETKGSVGEILVAVGDAVGEKSVLARLRSDRLQQEFDEAKSVYTEARKKYAVMETALKNANKNGASDDGLAQIEASAAEAKEKKDEAYATVQELMIVLECSELKSPSKGVVQEIMVAEHTMVDADEAVIKINPKDHFYLFNKSLAIFSFFAFWVFLAIHILAR